MYKRFLTILLVLILSSISLHAEGDKDKEEDVFSSATFSGLKFRNIGPAFTSGRIADFAVNPNNFSEYYVGVACGMFGKLLMPEQLLNLYSINTVLIQ